MDDITLHQGWVFKKNERGLREKWNSRYLVLYEGRLCYFANTILKESNLKQKIVIDTDTSIGIVPSAGKDGKQKYKKPNCFEVNTPSRTYVFSCQNKDEMETWIYKLVETHPDYFQQERGRSGSFFSSIIEKTMKESETHHRKVSITDRLAAAMRGDFKAGSKANDPWASDVPTLPNNMTPSGSSDNKAPWLVNNPISASPEVRKAQSGKLYSNGDRSPEEKSEDQRNKINSAPSYRSLKNGDSTKPPPTALGLKLAEFVKFDTLTMTQVCNEFFNATISITDAQTKSLNEMRLQSSHSLSPPPSSEDQKNPSASEKPISGASSSPASSARSSPKPPPSPNAPSHSPRPQPPPRGKGSREFSRSPRSSNPVKPPPPRNPSPNRWPGAPRNGTLALRGKSGSEPHLSQPVGAKNPRINQHSRSEASIPVYNKFPVGGGPEINQNTIVAQSNLTNENSRVVVEGAEIHTKHKLSASPEEGFNEMESSYSL